MKQLLILFALVCSIGAFGQSNKMNLNGTVSDSAGASLPGATVVLLQASDSIMSSFGITNKDGQFRLIGVETGEYVLQFSFLGYKTLNKPLTLKAGEKDRQLGSFTLQSAAQELGAVEITADHVPIKLKKDTIEYNADAFKTQPHSVVEDLLKQLPGVEVDKDGTIKAQGETVEKIYVDGKEFFADDPKLASKNLPADAIKKVQVFDEKSEFTQFSGIDDGERTKTINLALKEGRKKGIFGTVEGGYGTDDRFSGRVNLNRFDKKRQMSFLGMANNINEQGFSFRDYINFVGGIGALMNGGGGGRGGLPIGVGASDGFLTTGAGGVNFNQQFSKKTDWRSSYFINHVNQDYRKELERENILENGSYDENETDEVDSRNTSHRFNFRMKHEIDSMQDLRLRGTVTYSDGSSTSTNQSRTFNTEGLLQNSSDRFYSASRTSLGLNGDLLYRRKFQRKGRTLSLRATTDYSDDDQEGRLFSNNRFLTDSLLTLLDTLRQDQNQTNDELTYTGRIVYTEPIGKREFLRFDLSRSTTTNKFDKEFIDIVEGVSTLNEQASLRYDREYTYNRGGVSYKLIGKKSNLTLTAAAQQSVLDGVVEEGTDNIRQEFLNFLPSASYFYDFENRSRLALRYRTSVNEPSLEQLQPVVDNSDPLNIYIGNPDLRPQFSHTVSLNYNYFDQFSFRSIFLDLRGTYATDKITNSSVTSDLFVQTTRPVNVDQDLNVSGSVSFGSPLRPLKLNIDLSLNGSFNQGLVFINGVESDLERQSNTVDVRLSNLRKKIIDVGIGVNLSQSNTSYSINDRLDQSFLNSEYYADLNWTIGKKWNIESDFAYTVYDGAAFSDVDPVGIWSGSISRFFLAGNRGRAKLSVFDLLNQNIGINRTAQLNFIQEERISSLGRYFMLSISYKLTKIGGRAKKNRSKDTEEKE